MFGIESLGEPRPSAELLSVRSKSMCSTCVREKTTSDKGLITYHTFNWHAREDCKLLEIFLRSSRLQSTLEAFLPLFVLLPQIQLCDLKPYSALYG